MPQVAASVTNVCGARDICEAMLLLSEFAGWLLFGMAVCEAMGSSAQAILVIKAMPVTTDRFINIFFFINFIQLFNCSIIILSVKRGGRFLFLKSPKTIILRVFFDAR